MSCGTSCRNDTACSPGEKCCAHGCCTRCLRAEPAPLPGPAPSRGQWVGVLPRAHPGLCPPMTDGHRAAKCLLLCLQDRDCPPEQKCCLQGCGRTCVPPLQGKTPP
uniref:WAP domain-containing protein n=1 Tax=Amazona collaria TaxID=241587 RepID=A0A8B9IWX4_9PSIT